MPLDFPDIQLHVKILLLRYRGKYDFQIRDVFLGNNHRERIPIHHLKERGNKVIRDYNRNTLVKYSLNYSRTVDFIALWADAVSAAFHKLYVVHLAGNASWHSAQHFHIWLLVLPVFEQDWVEVAVHASCVKCECLSLRRDGEGDVQVMQYPVMTGNKKMICSASSVPESLTNHTLNETKVLRQQEEETIGFPGHALKTISVSTIKSQK
ncbi:heat shock factor 3 [Striga asiatica]|uniref:Heat shock factor 3 n=1 Tax=Striga asiatica TaxID=4170 RepID=A0A5A7NXW2_STRAF|nr:heat shock factor 3 [Striga asiatica]